MSQDITTRIQVVALTDSKETADLLQSLLAEEPNVNLRVSKMAFGEGVKAVGRYEPHLVVVADTIDDPAAAVEELDSEAPNVPVLAIVPEGALEKAQECVLAGARATLVKPFDRASLLHAVQQIYLKETRRKQFLAAALDAGTARPQRPRIIAVHGAKGGVGATVVACNVAAVLRGLTGRRVALVDADLLCADVGVQCDVASPRSISDLLPALRDLDADFLNNVLVEHPTGMRILLAPEQLPRAESIRGEDMQRTLVALKPYFDYTIVDTPSRITPVTLAALDEADLIVLVVTPELVALRDAAQFVELAAQLGYPEDKLALVVNRADSGRGINAGTIEEQLRCPVAATIPSDGRALVDCINAGDLIVSSRPGHKVAKSIAQLAQAIAASFGWQPVAGEDHATPSQSSSGTATVQSNGHYTGASSGRGDELPHARATGVANGHAGARVAVTTVVARSTLRGTRAVATSALRISRKLGRSLKSAATEFAKPEQHEQEYAK
ncbi:MAG: AAA family ATPase [Chloroflexi bacterium]|nr:AAA family ATPase [Chloroflexota bacterium]